MWFILKKNTHFNACILVLTLVAPGILLLGTGYAREFKVGTGLNVDYEWYERNYVTETENEADQTTSGVVVTTTEDLTNSLDDEYSRFRITPMIDIESLTARDALRLQYMPSFRYDIESYEHDIDHKLNASFSRYITQNWHLSLAENFILSDIVEDTSTEDSTDINELSDNDGRRLYLNNDLFFATSYTYWEDSSLTFNYTYTILEDVDDDDGSASYNNYDRHTFLISVGHRFDSIWRAFFSSAYVRGLYDENELQPEEEVNSLESDLEEFRITSILHANLIEHHPLSLAYSFYGVDYDEAERKSNAINNLTLGWEWSYSKDVTLSLGGGPSYTKTDGQDGNWGYNGNLGIQYNFKNGNFRLSGERGYDRQNFSGTDENGLKEYWQARSDISYRIWEDLSFSIYASYRYEDQEIITGIESSAGLENGPEFELFVLNKEISRTGATLRYFFEQWYNLSISYNFTHQVSERLNDSYDEHRFLIALNFKKDVFKW